MASHAWNAFGIVKPSKSGAWVTAAVGVWPLPALRWGKSEARIRLDPGFHSAEERRRAVRTGVDARLSSRQRMLTPEPFRDALLEIARAVREPC